MKKIKVGCSIGIQGCKIEDEIEVDDDATSEEIDLEAREWALSHFEWWVKDNDHDRNP